MIKLRRLSQLFFLGFFIYLIFRTVDPLSSFIPVNLFFISDPLIAIGTSIAARVFILSFLAALVVIVITILLGRVFCGWACPLGTTIDWFDKILLWWFKKRVPVSLKWRKIKYVLLIALIIGAFFGINAIGWLDPISLSFKSYGLFLYSASDWMGKKILTDENISPIINLGILDRNNITFNGLIIIASIFLVILLLSLVEKRFWCRNLCPLGALLGLLSKWRLVHTAAGEDCSKCALCKKACKMGAINTDLETLDEECIYCYKCMTNCPKEQLSITYGHKKQQSISVLPSRRGFLLSGLLGIASAPILKYTLKAKYTTPLAILRPPGSEKPEEEFLAKCIRCGECMKVCPTNAIQPLILEGGLYSMFSPVLIPRIGFCLYECNLCGKVCPTGAIKNLSLKKKKQSVIGVAKTNWNLCINCLVCEEYCPVPNKAIDVVIHNEAYYPKVIKHLCIGCGSCENVCPKPPAIKVFNQ